MSQEKISFKIITLNWVKGDISQIPTESGVYQIYGTSPLYGIDTLLYIGQAKNLNHRLKTHFESKESVIGRQPNKSCLFATVNESLLDVVEQTLIVMHKPSFNSASLINVKPIVKSDAFYIQNHGERGMLNIEVTNYYFLKHPGNNNVEFEIMPTFEDK
ncbi:MAG: GIY-YIG nuclease family protein [Sphingobacteriales bacterium]|nr:GIY-YIG nuclease family protein [Sphingobacteriales bacterium]MBI3718789.1 GIY-YIG nuclease family protein [Sphingobacteriales bacterium]